MAMDPEHAKRAVSALFDRVAAGYDRVGPRFLGHFGQALVGAFPPSPGSRVLDIACGKGALLGPILDRIGPQGKLVGVDLSEGMLAQARQELGPKGAGRLELRRMDAQALEFPDTHFDAVFIGFGLFFFPDPMRALEEARRVLKPGGRLAASWWARDCGYLLWTKSLLAGFLPPEARARYEANAPHDMDTAEGLGALLAKGGYTEVTVAREAGVFHYADVGEWYDSLWTTGIRMALESLDAGALERFQAHARAEAEKIMEPQGLPAPFAAWFGTGIKG